MSDIKVSSWFGVDQLGLEDATDGDEFDGRVKLMLAREMNSGRLVAFVGAGVSVNYGLNSWSEMVGAVMEAATKELKESSRSTAELAALQDYAANGLLDRHISREDVYLVALEESKRILGPDRFRDELGKAMKRPKPREEGADPLKSIFTKLEVDRFVTTNYDHVIENRYYGSTRGNATEETRAGGFPIVTREPNSLSVDPARPQDLLNLAVATPDNEHGIFHIHGKIDDPAH